MHYVIENAGKVIPLAFAGVGLLLLIVIVLGNLVGYTLTLEVFDLLKLVIVGSFTGAGASAMTGAAMQRQVNALREKK